MKAKVIGIQVGGYHTCHSLRDACKEYLSPDCTRTKIHFFIELPNGERKAITIRDEENMTVAYGDFERLPSFIDYAREIAKEEVEK